MFTAINKYPLLAHSIFWLGILLLDTVSGDVFKKFHTNLVFGVGNLIPQIIAAYFTVYYLIPKFIPPKKYGQFVIFFLFSAYLISALSRIIVVYFAEPIVRIPPFEQESIAEIFLDVKWLVLRYFPSNYIVVLFFWLITFLDFSRRDLSRQKEKTAAELKILKSQLNPHFLFNTLNNIYSLSLDNSPKTSDSIGRLSKILDYVLYRCESKLVPLAGEIQLLEDYIALEEIRYTDRLKITFKREINSEIEIAPLILLSLVENAFKHGAGEDEGSPKIDIVLKAEKNFFKFIISNSLVKNDLEKTQANIGLKNIKKQLDLIYPNRYQLKIDKQDNLFTVTLRIKLHS